MKKRILALNQEEELECALLIDSGVLNAVAEHYCVSYREAYFIHKGKIAPSYSVDDCSLTRWF